MNENDDIRQILNGDQLPKNDPDRTRKVMNRARRQVGQRDTLTFALVKVWATLARLLAPFFAAVGEGQARALQRTKQGE